VKGTLILWGFLWERKVPMTADSVLKMHKKVKGVYVTHLMKEYFRVVVKSFKPIITFASREMTALLTYKDQVLGLGSSIMTG
jgi:hypothetical protein